MARLVSERERLYGYKLAWRRKAFLQASSGIFGFQEIERQD